MPLIILLALALAGEGGSATPENSPTFTFTSNEQSLRDYGQWQDGVERRLIADLRLSRTTKDRAFANDVRERARQAWRTCVNISLTFKYSAMDLTAEQMTAGAFQDCERFKGHYRTGVLNAQHVNLPEEIIPGDYIGAVQSKLYQEALRDARHMIYVDNGGDPTAADEPGDSIPAGAATATDSSGAYAVVLATVSEVRELPDDRIGIALDGKYLITAQVENVLVGAYSSKTISHTIYAAKPMTGDRWYFLIDMQHSWPAIVRAGIAQDGVCIDAYVAQGVGISQQLAELEKKYRCTTD